LKDSLIKVGDMVILSVLYL